MKVSNYSLLVLTAAILTTNLSLAATFNVTNSNDSGPGSLRQAMIDANNTAGQDNIIFPNNSYNIQITSQLPALTDNAGVIIDGYSPSGPGSCPNSNPQGQPSNALLKVVITANLYIDGIYIYTWNNTLRGLVINNFARGIVIDGSLDEACNNYIVGCYIGTDYTGTIAVPNFIGISVINGAGNNWNNNYIGDGTNAGRNLISGNNNYGIELNGPGTEYNQIWGNYIGTEKNGTSPLGNVASGIRIENGASYNSVGGFCLLPQMNRNIISGNGAIIYDGIDIKGPGTSNNTVSYNFIGTDCTGSYAIPNGQYGVCIFNGAFSNTVAGEILANSILVISGNNAGGVWIEGINTCINTIDYAYIGLNAAGTGAIPNNGDGVYVNNGAGFNNIGMASGLIIAGNLGDGIRIEGAFTNYNLVRNASIGLPAMGNGGNGIHILDGPQYTQIGDGWNSYLVISYNALNGILIDNAQLNTVSSNVPWFMNQITNNTGNGISVVNQNATGNTFSMNIIDNNGGLGIDLNNDGMTPNDLNDSDPGPNELWNFPVITSAVCYAPLGNGIITGTLDNGTPQPPARIEVYRTIPDPSGYGEASLFLGFTNPDASGFWTLNVQGVQMNQGDFVTAISIDLVNSNTSEFCQDVMVTEITVFDFSDAPAPYPTLLVNNGAWHQLVFGGPWLGNSLDYPDPEPDGMPYGPFADGDDNTGTSDDEDGVNFSPLYAGLFGTISFEVQNGPAWVDAWFDFNGNGIWGDMGGAENVISGLVPAGLNVVSFIIPVAAVNQLTYARFRINSTGPLPPTGLASDGEVEDYDMPVSALWVGGTPGAESDWSNPNNWSNGMVPTNIDDLVIPGGVTYPPVISGTVNCDDIFIQDGGILTLSSGANFTAAGNMTIGQGASGKLIVNAGFGQVIGTTFVNPGGIIQIKGGTFTP